MALKAVAGVQVIQRFGMKTPRIYIDTTTLTGLPVVIETANIKWIEPVGATSTLFTNAIPTLTADAAIQALLVTNAKSIIHFQPENADSPFGDDYMICGLTPAAILAL